VFINLINLPLKILLAVQNDQIKADIEFPSGAIKLINLLSKQLIFWLHHFADEHVILSVTNSVIRGKDMIQHARPVQLIFPNTRI